MTQQDTQPPAETLDDREAVARIINPDAWPSDDQAAAYPDADWDAVKRAAFAKTDAILAALTRRAGGDAIPAKEAFDAWRRAQPSGDERFPYDIAKAAFLAGRESATPKPPAGGDAIPAGEDALTHGERVTYEERILALEMDIERLKKGQQPIYAGLTATEAGSALEARAREILRADAYSRQNILSSEGTRHDEEGRVTIGTAVSAMMTLARESTTPKPPAGGDAGSASGTFACPICGEDKPHHHTSPVVDAYQTKGSRK